jgi:hypothetical protein
VKTRLSRELLDKLEAARKETGRSMAQEVEFRLERSVQMEGLIEDMRETMRQEMQENMKHVVELLERLRRSDKEEK